MQKKKYKQSNESLNIQGLCVFALKFEFYLIFFYKKKRKTTIKFTSISSGRFGWKCCVAAIIIQIQIVLHRGNEILNALVSRARVLNRVAEALHAIARYAIYIIKVGKFV